MTTVKRHHLSAIEEELAKSIKPVASLAAPFYSMLRYFLGWEDERGRPIQGRVGKRYRPALCLLVCEAVSGKWRHALPAAAAIELFHNFTLIHDDVQDHDQYRRGRKTVWAIWGTEQAINAGDIMFGLAIRAALRSSKSSQVIQILNNAAVEVVEGQYLDLSFLNRDKISVLAYLVMLRAKTAALVGAAAEMGAQLAIDDPKIHRAWRDFGESFGLAYQLYDDYRGVWSTYDETGKVEAGDIREGKKTLPFIVALERLPKKQSKRLVTLYRQPSRTKKEVNEIRGLFEEVNADLEVQRQVKQHKDRALQILRRIRTENPAMVTIDQLVKQLIP